MPGVNLFSTIRLKLINRKALLTAGLFLLALHSFAGNKVFVFDKTCREAYLKMSSWHFDEAAQLLKQAEQANPNNLIPYYLENYHDFLVLGFNEAGSDYASLGPNESKRLNMMKDGDEKSPYYLFTQSEIMLQWGLVKLKAKDYTSGFFDIRKAYNQLLDNKAMFPDFIANDKSLGLLHALIGTVPDSYKWAVRLLGFDGTVKQGTREMDSVINYGLKNDFIYTTETRYMYLLVKILVLNDTKGALAITENPAFPDYKGNPLSCFMKGYIAEKNFLNDKAITYFKYNAEVNNCPIHYNDYVLGIALLNKLDLNAEKYFTNFTNEFKGNNYLKDALHRLAWIALIQGDEKKYYALLEHIKPVGLTLTDSDKDAERTAQTKSKPNTTLLRARLLSDGGYNDKALNELTGKTEADFSKAEDKLEFTYRLARINSLLGNNDKAIEYYNTTITNGEKVPLYFAANSALELGNIYEERKDYANAKLYYQKCLNMPSSDYKDSLDVKAKAGLQRVSSKVPKSSSARPK